MISAWARMCKIIGRGFVQYLPVVMGPLIQAASLKPEIAFVDCKYHSNFYLIGPHRDNIDTVTQDALSHAVLYEQCML